MKKCQELANVLAQEYQQLEIETKIPRLEIKKLAAKHDCFRSQVKAGVLQIEASNALAQVYGISQMGVAVQSGHIKEFLGEIAPRFSLRPLWIGSKKSVRIGEKVGLYVPEFMCEPDAELLLPRFCRYLLECGFNSLLIGAYTANSCITKEGTDIDLKGIFNAIADHGIQVMVRPEFYFEGMATCPYDPIFREQVKESIEKVFEESSGFSHLFWESRLLTSRYRHHAKAQEAVEAEVVLEEIKLLENCLQDRSNLIFYVPASNEIIAEKQSKWLATLMDDMGKKTILSFSAVSGGFWEDHQTDHPFWKALRESQDSSATPLIPIVNAGLIHKGEGLWPVWNCGLLDRFLARCSGHKFAGVIVPANHLPVKRSLLDGNLWTAGQSLWRNVPAHLLLETWFKTYRKGENFEEARKVLELGSEIANEMSYLRSIPRKSLSSEECRHIAEYLLSQLKRMQRFIKSERKFHAVAFIADYSSFFVEDVKSFVDQFLQSNHVPSFQYFQGEKLQGAFWMKNGVLLGSPQRGESGSLLEKIYLENRWL